MGAKIRNFIFLPKWSLRVRLVGIFLFFFGIGIAGYSFYLYRMVNQVFRSEFDSLLINFTADVAGSIDVTFFGQLRLDSRRFRQDQELFPFSLLETLFQIRDPAGRTLQKSRILADENLPLDQSDLNFLEHQNFFLTEWTSPKKILGNNRYRMITYQVSSPDRPPIILQIAVPDRLVRQNSLKLARGFFLTIPSLLLVAALLGYIFSALALNPLKNLVQQIKSIEPSQLSHRLPPPLVEDEISELSSSINQLLERLELSFSAQETFIADASHQLKTPLTILKGELEQMLNETKEDLGAQEKIKSLKSEVDSLTNLVSNLLLLARIDSGEGQLVLAPVDIEEVLSTAIHRIRAFAAANSMRIKYNLIEPAAEILSNHSFEVRGDFELLVSLFQCLLENAVKYSERDSEIEVDLSWGTGGVRVVVRDYGPGIPQTELKRVFERFVRLPQAVVSGSGLGLAIAKKIADLHGAVIFLTSGANETPRRYGLEAHFHIKKI